MLIVTAEEAKQLDQWAWQQAGLPFILLMENAGRAVAMEIKKRFQVGSRVIVLAGAGNNGGDAIVAARYLLQWDYDVTLLLAEHQEKYVDDVGAFLQAYGSWEGKLKVWNEEGVDLSFCSSLFAGADLLLDGLLGTGLHGAPRGPYAHLIRVMNRSGRPILAIDLPSGLLADEGSIPGEAVQATWTVTFEAYKWAHMLWPASSKVGEVVVASIGIPPSVATQLNLRDEVLTPSMIRSRMPIRSSIGHKGSFGHLCVIGGSRWMPGAPQYSMEAAYRMGAGLVTLALPTTLAQALIGKLKLPLFWPWEEEGVHFAVSSVDGKDFQAYSALAIGPGIGCWEGGEQWLEQILEQSTQPLVLDADALKLLARRPQMLAPYGKRIIITPHPGEMAILCQVSKEEVALHRRELALQLAVRWKIYVVLKGYHTLIATPEGRLYCNPTGNVALAKGGTGDVLTGMIGGLLAQGVSPENAALIGTYLHGLIADLTALDPYSFTPEDVITQIPTALQHLLTNRSRG